MRKTGGCAKSIDNYCITVLFMIYIRICLLNLLQELYALVAERRNSYYVLLISLSTFREIASEPLLIV